MTEQEKNFQRYFNASHAIQTGVAYEHNHGSQDGSPKHLRTGINMRAVDHAALITLLVSKGIFTLEEYSAVLAAEAEAEKKRYEERIGFHLL